MLFQVIDPDDLRQGHEGRKVTKTVYEFLRSEK